MSKLCIIATLLVCAALSATAAPTQSDSNSVNKLPDLTSLMCETCESVVAQVQAQLPDVRPKLDQLCQYCGSPENNQKCLDKLHELEDKLEHETPRNVCVQVGLCHPKDAAKVFYDFSGQF